MLLTKCASCAAPLGSGGKKCSRCKTRYCGPDCQKEHWERGGHEALCKKIKKAGGAEQYHANKNYKQAVAVAVEDSAADTEGQTCYICQEAVHPQTGEGLVRGCACGDRAGVASGSTGIAHVSCLMEQAKVLVAEARDHRIEGERMATRWERWHRCQLCGQDYHGVVLCALGWACWKTYVGRPESDPLRRSAMGQLGNSLSITNSTENALEVFRSIQALERRFGPTSQDHFATPGNIAHCLSRLGREDEAMHVRQRIYDIKKAKLGAKHYETLYSAVNLAASMLHIARKEIARKQFLDEQAMIVQVKGFLREVVSEADDALGSDHLITIRLRQVLGRAIPGGIQLNDKESLAVANLESLNIFTELRKTAIRVLGKAHPVTREIEKDHDEAMTSNRFAVAALVEALGGVDTCVSGEATVTVAGLHEVMADQCAPAFIDVAVMWCAKKGLRSVDWIREAGEASDGEAIDLFLEAVGLEGSKAALIKRRIQNLEAYLRENFPDSWEEVLSIE